MNQNDFLVTFLKITMIITTLSTDLGKSFRFPLWFFRVHGDCLNLFWKMNKTNPNQVNWTCAKIDGKIVFIKLSIKFPLLTCPWAYSTYLHTVHNNKSINLTYSGYTSLNNSFILFHYYFILDRRITKYIKSKHW